MPPEKAFGVNFWGMLLALTTLFFSPFATAANPSPSALPPKVLYHMGQKKHLQENERSGIPDEVWEQNIMGRGTHFGLVPYRRGLYGGKNFDSLELYGNRYLEARHGGKKIPWVMKITIKDECLRPEHVTDLATDQNYLKWLFTNAAYLMQNASFCLNLKTSDCAGLVIGTQAVSHGREENVCDDLMQKMLVETKAKVVRDTEWDSSWYIRDRACIEKMEANANSTLDTLAEAKWDWESRKRTHSGITGGYGSSAFLILVGALREAEVADPSVLSRLREKLAASDIRLRHNDGPQPLWIREAGPALVDAFSRCQALGKKESFRARAEIYEKEVYSLFEPRIDYNEQTSRLEGAAATLASEMNAICR